jgi:hypothetical protein
VPVTVPVSEHTTSTVHLFHTTHTPAPAFGIPPNNVGYQMLLHKYDWEQDRGLGVEGQGRLEPIATRLRAPDDRKGVGHEATLARPLRITHTKARHGNEDGEEEEEEVAPLLPNEALALEEARKEKGQMKKNRKNKRKRKEKREQKREREDLQRRRDQGVREAVYNEYPALIAPY